jgi:ParB/RepB/Spo0J family partition protein
MDLELHQLELRYQQLRTRDPRRERQLTASLAEVGQLMPIVVVAGDADGRYVVVDGYKRVRAARRLRQDTVRATRWELDEAEALMLERLMRTSERESPLEQGWLLSELRSRFGLKLEELARRFDKSASWVSRRLALVDELPAAVQEQVRTGQLPAYAAMKHLVPLARAKRDDCVRLATALAGQRLSTRELGSLCDGFRHGGGKTRELVLTEPLVFLRARAAAQAPEPTPKSVGQQLLDDLGALGGIARRVTRRLREGAARGLLTEERAEVRRCGLQARTDGEALWRLADKELHDAGPEHPGGDPQAG